MIPWLNIFATCAEPVQALSNTQSTCLGFISGKILKIQKPPGKKQRKREMKARQAPAADQKAVTIETLLKEGSARKVANFVLQNPTVRVRWCEYLKQMIWDGNIAMVRLLAGLIAFQGCCDKCFPNCFENVQGKNARSPLSMAQKLAKSNPSNTKTAAIVAILSYRACVTMDSELTKIPAMECVERKRLNARKTAVVSLMAMKSMRTGIDRFVLTIIAQIVFKDLMNQQPAA